ncbi:MAG: TetR/AcrR family transcriptional regulator [Bacteroidota bacterium]|nr:TetR/AcrR family transcriptional regulator [Bacteroidota bacterium]
MSHFIYLGGILMPKVKNDYFEQKKDIILSAAFNVCKRKPLFQVTMKDIIRETGLSQGGIYRYYKSIDEILVEVINRSTLNIDYIQLINDLVINGKTATDSVKSLFGFLAEYINNSTTTLGKFHFEIIELIAYEPDRIKSISAQNMHVNNTQHFIKCLFEVIKRGIAAEEFKPSLPLNDILSFISTSISGIVLDSIFHKCYGLPEYEYGFDVHRLMNTLEMSVIRLLCPDAADIMKMKQGELNNE